MNEQKDFELVQQALGNGRRCHGDDECRCLGHLSLAALARIQQQAQERDKEVEQMRGALELAIMTVECASIDIRTGEELPWYRAAKSALNAEAKPEAPATGGCMADWGPGEEEAWDALTPEQQEKQGPENLRAAFAAAKQAAPATECACRSALERISPYFNHGCHLHLPDGSVFNPSDVDAALAAPCQCAELRESLEFAKDFGEGAHRLVGHLQRELERMRSDLAAANERAEKAEADYCAEANENTASVNLACDQRDRAIRDCDTARKDLAEAVEALRKWGAFRHPFDDSAAIVSRFDAQGGPDAE